MKASSRAIHVTAPRCRRQPPEPETWTVVDAAADRHSRPLHASYLSLQPSIETATPVMQEIGKAQDEALRWAALLIASVGKYLRRVLVATAPSSLDIELGLRLAVAATVGMIMGLERRTSHRPAGVRTMSLVAMGAATFTIVSRYGFAKADQARVAASVASGVGFIGAGVITTSMKADFRGRQSAQTANDVDGDVRGLTTASAIWITAGLGMACGAGLFFTASLGTIMAVAILKVSRVQDTLRSQFLRVRARLRPRIAAKASAAAAAATAPDIVDQTAPAQELIPGQEKPKPELKEVEDETVVENPEHEGGNKDDEETAEARAALRARVKEEWRRELDIRDGVVWRDEATPTESEQEERLQLECVGDLAFGAEERGFADEGGEQEDSIFGDMHSRRLRTSPQRRRSKPVPDYTRSSTSAGTTWVRSRVLPNAMDKRRHVRSRTFYTVADASADAEQLAEARAGALDDPWDVYTHTTSSSPRTVGDVGPEVNRRRDSEVQDDLADLKQPERRNGERPRRNDVRGWPEAGHDVEEVEARRKKSSDTHEALKIMPDPRSSSSHGDDLL